MASQNKVICLRKKRYKYCTLDTLKYTKFIYFVSKYNLQNSWIILETCNYKPLNNLRSQAPHSYKFPISNLIFPTKMTSMRVTSSIYQCHLGHCTYADIPWSLNYIGPMLGPRYLHVVASPWSTRHLHRPSSLSMHPRQSMYQVVACRLGRKIKSSNHKNVASFKNTLSITLTKPLKLCSLRELERHWCKRSWWKLSSSWLLEMDVKQQVAKLLQQLVMAIYIIFPFFFPP